jgi:hypothetical protein
VKRQLPAISLAVDMAHLPALESLDGIKIKNPVVVPNPDSRDVEKGSVGVESSSEGDDDRL